MYLFRVAENPYTVHYCRWGQTGCSRDKQPVRLSLAGCFLAQIFILLPALEHSAAGLQLQNGLLHTEPTRFVRPNPYADTGEVKRFRTCVMRHAVPTL